MSSERTSWTVREIYTKFEELIALQTGLIGELTKEKAQSDADAKAYGDRFDAALNDVFDHHLGEDVPAALTELATVAGNESDFTSIVAAHEAANKRRETEIGLLQGQYDGEDAMAAARLIAQVDLYDADQAKRGAETVRDALATCLKSIEDHNARFAAEGAPINPGNVDRLQNARLHFWTRWPLKLFPSFRSAFKTLAAMDHADGTLYTSHNLRQDRQRAIVVDAQIEESRKTILALADRDRELAGAQDRIAILRSEMASPAEIMGDVRDAFFGLYDSDPTFAAVVRDEAPEETALELIESGVKRDNTRKLGTLLGARLKEAEGTKAELQKPMSKLRRAKSSNGSHRVPKRKLDLDDIEQKVKAGAAVSTYQLVSALNTREAISSYDSSTSSSTRNDFDLLTYQNMFMFWLINDMMIDPAFASSNLGLDAGVAGDLGLDVTNLAPDLGGVLSQTDAIAGLDMGDAFNQLGGQLANIDVGQIDVGQMDFNVNVDVPTITIDTGGITDTSSTVSFSSMD